MHVIQSEIVFDERFCHSAGVEGDIYQIAKGTNRLVFRFGDFDSFIRTYIRKNRYLPASVKHAVQRGSGHFSVHLVQDEGYVFKGRVADGNTIVFHKDTLVALKGATLIEQFSEGVIAFGIAIQGEQSLILLWATRYQSA